MFELYSTQYVHNPICISRNDNFVAINGAISVDLAGQIASSHIGTRLYSGTGGQFSYALGAFMSRGGRSITAFSSTTREGTVSRIMPHFVEGQIVTVPRDIADIVVTEYRVAYLLNKTERERAAALISVAHPDFRDDRSDRLPRSTARDIPPLGPHPQPGGEPLVTPAIRRLNAPRGGAHSDLHPRNGCLLA